MPFPDRFGPFQVKNRSIRHTRESGYPVSAADWIPAFAGMTASENHEDENLPGIRMNKNPFPRGNDGKREP